MPKLEECAPLPPPCSTGVETLQYDVSEHLQLTLQHVGTRHNSPDLVDWLAMACLWFNSPRRPVKDAEKFGWCSSSMRQWRQRCHPNFWAPAGSQVHPSSFFFVPFALRRWSRSNKVGGEEEKGSRSFVKLSLLVQSHEKESLDGACSSVSH